MKKVDVFIHMGQIFGKLQQQKTDFHDSEYWCGFCVSDHEFDIKKMKVRHF